MDDRKRPEDEEPGSALHVVPGVGGGHDGLPGGETEPAADRGEAARRRPLSTDEYVDGVLSGDRVLLGRAITLIESNAPGDLDRAQEVLQRLLPHAGRSVRIGVTGVPGAGKSTLIESLGMLLTGRGHRVAVTAVDPSSSRSGGSLLGDKTRMERLAADPAAFIRPSPTGGTLGGVTRKTRETILVFEAAGHDVILVETVGVGQSETAVRGMVDFFLLVLIAGAGDELQGLKKGIMELADAVLINKADGDGLARAEAARADYEQVLHYLRPATEGWRTGALTASALTGAGVPELWDVIERFVDATRRTDVFARRRRDQERAWMRALVRDRILERLWRHPRVAALLPDLDRLVEAGELPATTAARRLLDAFREEIP